MADSACEHAEVAGRFSFKTMEESVNGHSQCDVSVCESMLGGQGEAKRARHALLCDDGQAQRQLSSQHSDERANVMEEKNRRRADRYDSSESSDSGVASMTCSDASSWSSSSDITEPISPDSPESQASPLSQPGTSEAGPVASLTPAPSPPLSLGSEGERKRRHSDSSRRPTKRTRRMSSPCGDPTADWAPLLKFPPKWLEYHRRHLPANEGNDLCLTAAACQTQGTKRHLAVDAKVGIVEPAKGAVQTKITHFFKTQVKHWSSCTLKSSLRATVQQNHEQQVKQVEVAAVAVAQQIRFPAASPSKSSPAQMTCGSVCLWKECRVTVSSNLLEHIQTAHVMAQAARGENVKFTCHWEGCKVAGRCSSSKAWLERHVLCHVGSKPFRCIVESCGQRFGTQVALERHVNAHFSQENSQSSSSNGVGKKDAYPPKLVRRNSKKLRNCRKQVSARLFDVFDAGVMERLRHQLFTITKHQATSALSTRDHSVTVHSKVLARRIDNDGQARVLIRWSPENILPDEWVQHSQVPQTRKIPIGCLSASVRARLLGVDGSGDCATTNQRKNRRKL